MQNPITRPWRAIFKTLGLAALLFAFATLIGNTGNAFSPSIFVFDIAAGDVGGLIEAIDTANLNGVADVINLEPGSVYVLDSKHNDENGANGLPSIRTKITIEGNGATILRDENSEPFRIFQVFDVVGDLTLNNLTISGGLADALDIDDKNGGAIANHAVLQISRSVITGNEAPNNGGGIFNEGTLFIVESEIRDNRADKLGGGIYTSRQLSVRRSTISNNRSDGSLGAGGGIYNTIGEVTINNSTISGNLTIGSLDGGGGGINNDGGGTLDLYNSTVTNNETDSSKGGGGILNFVNATARIQNTIIAGNRASELGPDCIGTFASFGHNVVQDLGENGEGEPPDCVVVDVGNTTGNIFGQDPMIGELTDNGGPTRTHALIQGSPAIDQIPVEDCTDAGGNPLGFDQRGTVRPLDGDDVDSSMCDIGAYEHSLVCGDVDGDGLVELADVRYVLRQVVGMTGPEYLNLALGDLDRAGGVTVLDTVAGLKQIVDADEIEDCGPIP